LLSSADLGSCTWSNHTRALSRSFATVFIPCSVDTDSHSHEDRSAPVKCRDGERGVRCRDEMRRDEGEARCYLRTHEVCTLRIHNYTYNTQLH
jgi:hypothetical protein